MNVFSLRAQGKSITELHPCLWLQWTRKHNLLWFLAKDKHTHCDRGADINHEKELEQFIRMSNWRLPLITVWWSQVKLALLGMIYILFNMVFT